MSHWKTEYLSKIKGLRSKVNRKFIMYVPGSNLTEFHKRSPWLMLPIAFMELGYFSTLICGKYSLKSNYGINIVETIQRKNNILRSLFEPILGFGHILTYKPDIVIISPIGSYIFPILPLIILHRIYSIIIGNHSTKYILKTDWSLDFTGLSALEKRLSLLLLVHSSYVFDMISLETYCGVKKAKAVPLIKIDTLKRVPLGFPQRFFNESLTDESINGRIIICTARISPMKGQIVLVKAFLYIANEHPEWKLRFVGPIDDVEYKKKIDSLIQSSNMRDKISFAGFVNENVLYEELKNASIFCLPSIYLESAGQVKYEAIASGLPVVTTDVPCRKDDEELGCLVSKAGDVEALARNLELLIADPELRRNIVKHSKEKLLSYRDVATLYRDL